MLNGVHDMGARAPPNVRTRRSGLRCDFCGRQLGSPEALESHLKTLHATALKEKGKKEMKIVPRAKKVPLVAGKVQKAKKAVAKPMLKEVAKKMPLDKSKQKSVASDDKKGEKTQGKIEFHCPVCNKIFPVFFSAQRHAKKHHSVDDDGNTVEPSKLIPITMEFCSWCNKKCPVPHDCQAKDVSGYNCLGCDKGFNDLEVFLDHVVKEKVHGGIDKLFFPNEEDFGYWKQELEEKTNDKYTEVVNYNNRKIFTCNLPPDALKFTVTPDGITTHLCPSVIITEEVLNGVEVTFNKVHKGHKKNTKAEKENGLDSDDLYVQFKTVMDNIVLDAAKININTLKVLLDKAEEMNKVLMQYDEDDDELVVNRSIISLKTYRKVNSKSKPHEKSFSLADDRDTEKILEELDGKVDVRTNVKPKKNVNSPSFNDSYKEFIDSQKNSNKSVSKKPQKKIVKTKIGQFKPSLSPKKRQSSESVREMEYEVRERENDCNILVLKI